MEADQQPGAHKQEEPPELRPDRWERFERAETQTRPKGQPSFARRFRGADRPPLGGPG